MYNKAYGIIETLAPLHIGAAAGEETGNLNLIFRDQFTQTAILPGSSIRGRLRADMRLWAKDDEQVRNTYGRAAEKVEDNQKPQFESRIKIEYASVVWIPVFAPGQPIVWVSCPRLLRRYQRIAGNELKGVEIPQEHTASSALKNRKSVFFNFGFVELKNSNNQTSFSQWFPLEAFADGSDAKNIPAVIVSDNEIAAIHDMALYRQSRVALEEHQKVVAGSAFFNVEALPEGTILAFPIGIKKSQDDSSSFDWKPFKDGMEGEIYLGGLESVGFGHCRLTVQKAS